ncbi:MAG: hypothetical protein ABSB66_09795 [Candidatus Acidiferrales bacterium]|jgi:hypothetical protein
MTIFDLIFILLFFVMLGSLLWAAACAVRGQFSRAGRILIRIAACAALYMAIVIVASAILPRRTVNLRETQCFDDYCATVDSFRRIPQSVAVEYSVDLRLSNRARRGSEREKNLVMYLIDARGRRYDPEGDKSSAPYTVLLAPQESAVVTRSYLLPNDAGEVGAVVTHEGGFPIGWLIIGYDTWFQQPPRIVLK